MVIGYRAELIPSPAVNDLEEIRHKLRNKEEDYSGSKGGHRGLGGCTRLRLEEYS